MSGPDALDIVNHRQAVARLDDDERDTVHFVDGVGRKHELIIISWPGPTKVAQPSTKPTAKRFGSLGPRNLPSREDLSPKCPFRNFLNRVNRLGFKGGDLIRGGVTNVDA